MLTHKFFPLFWNIKVFSRNVRNLCCLVYSVWAPILTMVTFTFSVFANFLYWKIVLWNFTSKPSQIWFGVLFLLDFCGASGLYLQWERYENVHRPGVEPVTCCRTVPPYISCLLKPQTYPEAPSQIWRSSQKPLNTIQEIKHLIGSWNV